ncbi:MAG: squalene--hopene cyclase, partial [Verrucomicrobiota bacterium]
MDLTAFYRSTTRSLLDERNRSGHWTGELSTSALSTTTAIVALACIDRKQHFDRISGGIDWLLTHQNDDG